MNASMPWQRIHIFGIKREGWFVQRFIDFNRKKECTIINAGGCSIQFDYTITMHHSHDKHDIIQGTGMFNIYSTFCNRL